ncbi:unnamed protein product, partial [Allacma fusca]
MVLVVSNHDPFPRLCGLWHYISNKGTHSGFLKTQTNNKFIRSYGADVETQNQLTPLNRCEAKDSTLFTFHDTLEKFIQSNDNHVFLPKYLTPQQKNYLITLVQCMGLMIRSGRTEEAHIVKTSRIFPFVRMLVLAHETKFRIDNLMNFLNKESAKEQYKFENQKASTFRPATALTCGAPQVPPASKFSE